MPFFMMSTTVASGMSLGMTWRFLASSGGGAGGVGGVVSVDGVGAGALSVGVGVGALSVGVAAGAAAGGLLPPQEAVITDAVMSARAPTSNDGARIVDRVAGRII